MPDEESDWYEFLQDNSIATPEEIDLVCDVAGYSVNTMSLILHLWTGYDTREEYLGIEDDEEEEEDDEDA